MSTMSTRPCGKKKTTRRFPRLHNKKATELGCVRLLPAGGLGSLPARGTGLGDRLKNAIILPGFVAFRTLVSTGHGPCLLSVLRFFVLIITLYSQIALPTIGFKRHNIGTGQKFQNKRGYDLEMVEYPSKFLNLAKLLGGNEPFPAPD